ncbi:MAG: DNA polymerase/3'-5' exonuclease PolX [Terrimonas sp.]|nr:DNA polymerase/3'-5' exonuclease PolX [Terrimonas sp.]OJY92806.1 MAG: histidinol-phosphatase [Sphingobacteriales bacterium 40-81]
MDNYQVAEFFSLLSKLMDIHGENSFKSKSYSIAAFNIDKLPTPLQSLQPEQIFSIKGIGDATGKKILEIINTGKLQALEDYIQKTPPGIIEMLNIKGLGPKKIAVVWKEMGIESIGELLYACNENRLLLYKGFGEKTQQNVKSYIEFYLRSKGSYLFAEIEPYALTLQQQLQKHFSKNRFELTGAFRRQTPTIDVLEWVTDADLAVLEKYLTEHSFTLAEKNTTDIIFKSPENTSLRFYAARQDNFGSILFHTTSSAAFLNEWEKKFPAVATFTEEDQLFKAASVPYILPCLREKETIIAKAIGNQLPELIQPNDIKGIIHSHSNWSDGVNTIEEMAKACIDQGLEYLVISDHSKSAFYANGLKEDRIKEQHRYIDELNEKLKPFKIFKSIEADILNDGNLDYSDDILSTFDLVIASVHSNLKMPEEKAMMRLSAAIRNPYTTILGHLTGRLLLSREGYPVDHEKIIELCVENDVVIELNAHPRRLDMDWTWIDHAVEKGALISIDPDAHDIAGFIDTRYGVLAAQKARLTKQNNLSSFELTAFEQFLSKRKQKKGL